MRIFDRIIFGTIAVALMLIALQPLFADAGRGMDVNIYAVGGNRIFGSSLPTN